MHNTCVSCLTWYFLVVATKVESSTTDMFELILDRSFWTLDVVVVVRYSRASYFVDR
jgi:hypothetical protein